jgi:hypothetical protein
VPAIRRPRVCRPCRLSSPRLSSLPLVIPVFVVPAIRCPCHPLSPPFVVPAIRCPRVRRPHHSSSLPFVVPVFVVPVIRRPCVIRPCRPRCLLSPSSLPFISLLSWVPSSSAPPYPPTSSGSQTGWWCCVTWHRPWWSSLSGKGPVATLRAGARSGSVGCRRRLWSSRSRNRPIATLRAEAHSGSAGLAWGTYRVHVCRSVGRRCCYQDPGT